MVYKLESWKINFNQFYFHSELYVRNTEIGVTEIHPPLQFPVLVQPYTMLPHPPAQEAHPHQAILFPNLHHHIIVKMSQEAVTTVEMSMDQLGLQMSQSLKRSGNRYLKLKYSSRETANIFSGNYMSNFVYRKRDGLRKR